MDTQRSTKKVEEYRINRKKRRKTVVCTKEFPFPKKIVFEQLCPLKEYDWIEGWECNVISSKNGYAHKDCIFTTAGGANLGKGVWTFTKYEPDNLVELLIVDDIVVEQTTIELKENSDGSTLGTWTMVYTALNEEGNSFINSMSNGCEELKRALDGLEYYLAYGKILRG